MWHNFMEMYNDVFSNLIQIEIKLNKHMWCLNIKNLKIMQEI